MSSIRKTLACLLLAAPTLAFAQARSKSVRHVPETPTVEDTVAYINQKLAANPTPAWEAAGCPGAPYVLAAVPQGRYIDLQYPAPSPAGPCATATAHVPVFNLGRRTLDNETFYTGQTHRTRDVAVIYLICSTAEDCAGINRTFYEGKCDTCDFQPTIYGADLQLLSDDETLARVSRAVTHLVALLNQQAAPGEPDPFSR
jgi:hypothetical protein